MTDKNLALGTPYPASLHKAGDTTAFMVDSALGDRLVILGPAPGFTGDAASYQGQPCLVAALDHQNAQALRALFPFTRPRPGLKGSCSIGVGDRLGLATAGHLRVFERHDGVFPVLAQQSIRELNLTQRSYEEVLDSASFAVFKAGYTRGFGADGDHLKKPEEIEYALKNGFSMITLDCSEHIFGAAAHMDEQALTAAYQAEPGLEARYLDQEIQVEPGLNLHFSPRDLMRASLIYGKALAFTQDIYGRYIKGQPVDFEMSIDETATPTTPLEHYFVARELQERGVVFQSLAPRFCGEFQKGIDYLGDLKQFEDELAVHAAIARHFGYKLSVHSGSDKFLVFPAVGRLCQGVFHLKTAGTNWLEAVRLVALKDPAFYRELHDFALKSFKEASAYYHVGANLVRIPALDSLGDEQLPTLMNHDDARQLLHITYGLILTKKDEDGNFVYRDRLYALLHEQADAYADLLEAHIGRHLDLLLGK